MRPKSLLPSLVLVLCLAVHGSAVYASDPVTVQFWFGEDVESYIATMRQIVERFNEEHPHIQVEMRLHPSAQVEQLKVAIAAGVPPDVAYLDGTAILEFGLGNHMFIPVNEVLEPPVIESFNFLPVPTQEFQYKGVWYGLPFRTDSRGIYVNEDHFLEAGIDPRAGFATVSDLDEAAAKLTVWSSDGQVQRLGWAPNGNNFGGELPWLWIFGGEIYDWDRHRPKLANDPNNIRALEWILDYADRYGPNAKTGQTEFLGGSASMIINSTTRLHQYPELAPHLNWWVVQIPPAENGIQTTLSTGLGVAIPVGAAQPEAAAEFMLYLTRPHIQEFWYRNTQSLPVSVDAFQEIVRYITDERELNMVSLLPIARGYPPLYAYHTRPIFMTQLNAMRNRAATPEEVLINTEQLAMPRYIELFGGD